MLFGSSKAHKELRRILVEEQKLDGVVSLPSGAFKPYAGVSTDILLFSKTNSGGTDYVWFYDMQADGWSLDDKRQPLLPEDKLGLAPLHILSAEEHAKNNLPDVLVRWSLRDSSEQQRARTEQSFCVPKADIAANGYTTYPSTATRKWCTRKWSTCRPRKFSPIWPGWRKKFKRG